MLSQAVTYYQVLCSVWLVLLALLVGVAVWSVRRCLWGREECDYGDQGLWGVGVFVSGVVGCLAFLGWFDVAACLARSCYAPDYFAAEILAELGRKALGH
jgi:hypothetical protein